MILFDEFGRVLTPPDPHSFFGIDRSIPLVYGPTGDVLVSRPPIVGDGLAAWLPNGPDGSFFAFDPAVNLVTATR